MENIIIESCRCDDAPDRGERHVNHDSRTSIGRAGLMSLMGDPRYTDANHPEHDRVVDLIRRGFELVAGEADAPGFTTLFDNDAGGGRRIDLMNSDARADFGRNLLLRAIRAEGATMPSGFDREGVAVPGFRNPLAAPRADGHPAPREPQARKDDPAKLAPATPAQTQAGEGAKPPEQVAMSRRPSKAQQEIDEAKRNPGKEDIVFTMEESRQWAILNDRRVRFNIEDDPAEKGDASKLRDHGIGVDVVKEHDAIIEREAKRKGVDPDLVRAIIYMENADGNPLNPGRLVEEFGMASSILPMNIKPGIWAGLDGVKKEEFKNPEANIRAGVTLIKRIRDRLDDPTRAKIGSIWNFTGAEKVNEIGARIQKIFDQKTWLR
ncbi:MAG: hypothetical protein IIA72_12120 [Proteobacteria bacterium]|nr:hypothetical protein [Pseudomonadota bacterium]